MAPEKSSGWHRSPMSISFLHTPSSASMPHSSVGPASLPFFDEDVAGHDSALLALPPAAPRNGTTARDGKDEPGGRRTCSRRAARDSRRAHLPTSSATACARLTPMVDAPSSSSSSPALLALAPLLSWCACESRALCAVVR
uniref:Uncharacterized protein n=1 Tax=Triticum urartu TaxID=4572 RepID=A0A8R7UTP8_TRIUA